MPIYSNGVEVMNSGQPHVIVIMADQLRFDALGGPHTPHLNQLARESVTFERAYCASPLCVPARGAFFTGRYPNSTGCLINPWEPADAEHGRVKAGIANLFGLLENEWDSWNVGKQHFLTEEQIHLRAESKTRWQAGMQDYKRFLKEHGKRMPGGPSFKGLTPELAGGRVTRAKYYSIPTTGRYEEGFDFFFDGYFAQAAVEAIRSRDRAKPMLLNAMFLAPHPPFDVPEPWFSAVREAALPDNVGEWYPGQSPLQLYNMTGALGARYTRAEWAEIWKVYLGLTALLDHCVGMIIGELKRQGMYDDALIVFTSDHGEMLGSHRLWQKTCMYEEAVRTPLFFKLPAADGISPAVRDVPVSAVDVLPTLCDRLGIPVPEGAAGRSLLPVIRNGGTLGPRPVFIQSDGNGARGHFQRCVLDGHYKLIVDLFKDETYFELYASGDEGEKNNLAFDPAHAETVRGMLRTLQEHMAATHDLLRIPDGSFDRFLTDYGKS